jgi:hypothetical protein
MFPAAVDQVLGESDGAGGDASKWGGKVLVAGRRPRP